MPARGGRESRDGACRAVTPCSQPRRACRVAILALCGALGVAAGSAGEPIPGLQPLFEWVSFCFMPKSR